MRELTKRTLGDGKRGLLQPCLALLGVAFWLLLCVSPAFARHCPGGDISDCAQAAETAKNPLVPILAALAGVATGRIRKRSGSASPEGESSAAEWADGEVPDEFPNCKMGLVEELEAQLRQLNRHLRRIVVEQELLEREASESQAELVRVERYGVLVESQMSECQRLVQEVRAQLNLALSNHSLGRRSEFLLKVAKFSAAGAALLKVASVAAAVELEAAGLGRGAFEFAKKLVSAHPRVFTEFKGVAAFWRNVFGFGAAAGKFLQTIGIPVAHTAEWAALIKALKRSLRSVEFRIHDLLDELAGSMAEREALYLRVQGISSRRSENSREIRVLREQREPVHRQLCYERSNCGLPPVELEYT